MANIPAYFLNKKNPHDHKDKSNKHEARIAKKLGGRVQPGSGAIRHHKGDVKLKEMLIECKRTDRKGISLKREWIEKITQEAVNTGRVPAISLEFGQNKDDLKPKTIGAASSAARLTMPIERDWMAVPASFFQELLMAYKNGRAK